MPPLGYKYLFVCFSYSEACVFSWLAALPESTRLPLGLVDEPGRRAAVQEATVCAFKGVPLQGRTQERAS